MINKFDEVVERKLNEKKERLLELKKKKRITENIPLFSLAGSQLTGPSRGCRNLAPRRIA